MDKCAVKGEKCSVVINVNMFLGKKKEMKTIKFVDYVILLEHFTEIQCTIILVFQRNMRLKNV